MSDSPLRLIDGHGEVVEEGCPQCANLKDELGHARRELAIARTQISRMKSDRNRRRTMSAFAEPAQQVFERWNTRCREGKAREFGPARFDPVVERLEAGYTVQDFFVAIEGARLVLDRQTDFKPRDPREYTDLEKIARSARSMDRFIGYVDEVKDRRRDARRELRRAWTAAVEISGGDTERGVGPCLACGEANSMLVDDTIFVCRNGCDHEAQVARLRTWWKDVYRGAA